MNILEIALHAIADVTFVSATSLGSLKKCGSFFFGMCWEMLCGVLSAIRHSAAPAFSSFSFDTVNIHYMCHAANLADS